MIDKQEPDSHSGDSWPRVFRISGDAAFLAVLGILALIWLWFILYDLVQISGPVISPLWMELFTNDAPIEWLQWFVLIVAAVLAGYLSGKLRGQAASFFLLIAIAIALMFLEDASDLRFMLYLEYTSQMFGPQIAGVSTRMLTDLVFSTLILSVPVIAIARHLPVILQARAALTYLAGAVVYYANVVLLSIFRHVDGFPLSLGQTIDDWFFFSRWPSVLVMADLNQQRFIVEALMKETVEVVGAACFLAMVLAYAKWHRETERPE